MTSFTASGKPKRSIESLRVERQHRNAIDRFLAGTLPDSAAFDDLRGGAAG